MKMIPSMRKGRKTFGRVNKGNRINDHKVGYVGRNVPGPSAEISSQNLVVGDMCLQFAYLTYLLCIVIVLVLGVLLQTSILGMHYF